MGSGASKVDSHSSNTPVPDTLSYDKDTKEKRLTLEHEIDAKSCSSLDQNKNKTETNSLSQICTSEPKASPQLKKSNTSLPKNEVINLKTDISNKGVKSENDEIKRLNEELSSSESQRLDLLDQIQLLKGRCDTREQQHNAKSLNFESLQETLNAKDLYIQKLETEAKSSEAEAKKLRIKLKKRIKSLTSQLQETRQEASISQLELKAEIAKQEERIKSLKAGAALPSSSSGGLERHSNEDHSKIILELSSQVSEQAEQIAMLEADLSEKRKEIVGLKLAISNHFDSADSSSNPNPGGPNSLLVSTSTDRLHSSRGKRVTINNNNEHNNQNESLDSSSPSCANRISDNPQKPLERQSTALSDSDSDWGNSSSPVPSHTHSAPARSRVKSAISLASSGKHKGSLTTLNGNDDSIMDLVSASPIDVSSNPRADGNLRSSYRNHLDKIRQENQSNSLIGPTLAFEKTAEPFSDTSCEPTPRTQRTLHGKSKIRIVKPIAQ